MSREQHQCSIDAVHGQYPGPGRAAAAAKSQGYGGKGQGRRRFLVPGCGRDDRNVLKTAANAMHSWR
jgi:hypothetical protein